jgi:hypothetical protein
MSKQGGATICSETMINASLSSAASSDQQQSMLTLITQHTPTGQKLTGTTAQQSMELIGEALTTYQTSTATKSTTGTTGSTVANGMTASQALSTLKDFQTEGFITMVTQPVSGEQASLGYVQAPSSANADADNQTYIALAEALRKGGAGTVVGGSGDSAAKGGLVYAIINDSTATREISTVDNTDVTMGQVAAVFCLEAESQSGQSAAGHYGTGANNDGLLPPIATGSG